jgi:hypothetical protein
MPMKMKMKMNMSMLENCPCKNSTCPCKRNGCCVVTASAAEQQQKEPRSGDQMTILPYPYPDPQKEAKSGDQMTILPYPYPDAQPGQSQTQTTQGGQNTILPYPPVLPGGRQVGQGKNPKIETSSTALQLVTIFFGPIFRILLHVPCSAIL